MINQQEWLRTRKTLLEQVKSQVRLRLGAMPPTLRQYARGVERDFRATWRPVAVADLDRALTRARVVLSADFHAYAQSQREHVRLLRDRIGEKRVVVALECLTPSQESDVARFLAGQLTEDEFLQNADWERHWGFPWEHYRPVFELARDRGYEVRALHPDQHLGLKRRDEWAAKRIAEFLQSAPEAVVFVIMGEWHLAQAHLPKQLEKRGLTREEIVILHQDVEPLYFRLASRQREHSAEVLRASGNRFCMMISPPWMKWQSYLMYLEQAYDRDLNDELDIDYTDHIVNLIQVLASDLKVEIKTSLVQVYCPNAKRSLTGVRLGLPRRQEAALRHHLAGDQSFYVPQSGWLYLSRPTINHASALAGQYVHGQLAKRKRALWNMPDDFLALIWVEAVGFFFSKWINPKRKAETLDGIRLRLAARHPEERGRQALLLAMEHRLSEVLWVRTGRLRRAQYRPRGAGAYLDAARILGGMLGERLFQKVRSRTISLQELMSNLKVNVESAQFAKFYWQLIREVEQDQML